MRAKLEIQLEQYTDYFTPSKAHQNHLEHQTETNQAFYL